MSLFRSHTEALLAVFREGSSPDAKAYELLFQYFLEGFLLYQSPNGAGADYPGMKSSNGAACDRMEGFSRSAPLWAVWIAGGRPGKIRLESGTEADLLQLIRKGLVAGTDGSSSEYWGTMRKNDQLIVEAADIALVIWLTRNALWPELTKKDRQQIAAWLQQAEQQPVWDNNWHLFPVLVAAVLRDLGLPSNLFGAQQHYERFKQFYLGGGWFSDGKGHKIDYYNAWGIHYLLWWLRRIDPEWDNEFLRNTYEQFLSTYKYLIGPKGFPIMGRSVCYRIAVSAPLILAQAEGSAIVSPGQARRALDATWTYFIQRGGVREGNITQGYCCRPDSRVLDNYSGPASCLWGLRSLIAAFWLAPDHSFWSSAPEPLPVEMGDFLVEIPEIGWTVVGDKITSCIEIRKKGRATQIPLKSMGLTGRAAGWILRRPVRPRNTAAKYEASVYSSGKPFCGCRFHTN